MKNCLVAFIMLFSSISIAQIKTSIIYFSGYEKNINKNPDLFLKVENTLVDDDFIDDELFDDELLENIVESNYYIEEHTTLREDRLYQNSFYSDLRAKISYKKEWRYSDFKFSLTPRSRFFYTQEKLNHFIIPGKVLYSFDIFKNIKWENNVSFAYKERKGFNLDENEAQVPLGYLDVTGNSIFHFKLFKRNKNFLAFHFGKRDFENTEKKSIYYIRYGAEISSKKRFKIRSLTHSYGFNARFSNRNYSILKKGKESELVWQYATLGAFYKAYLTKKTALSFNLDYNLRLDKTKNKFGYKEWSPSLLLSYKARKYSWSLRGTGIYRSFTTIKARDNDNNKSPLVYKYFKANVNGSYKLSKKISLLIEASINNRETNNIITSSLAYRTYANFYSGIGISYKI
ncbi:hypothetical protein [Pseudofulvibacter geojedonensis]|uniref:Outer membrane protein beta-barrel domain-containing protein n=1 Tax=Pseudofulvibacter geojedonensis TaxID=1123758 RepID=A0ABW3I2C6_9FLAO